MPDQSATIVVLKKTKLGETDLIITGFTDEGHQVRAVAKAARKPGSKLGVHLELYSVARLLLYKGRTLDTIIEASGIDSNDACRADVLHSAGAAVVVELLDKVSMDGDSEPRLFPLAREALRCIGAVPDEGIALIAAATVLKVAAQLGVRPSLRECVFCGGAAAGRSTSQNTAAVGAVGISELAESQPARVAFSFNQGGIICEECLSEVAPGSYLNADAQLINWAEVLITNRFVDLERYANAEHEALGRALLDFSREWLRAHLVNRLKSLDFLITFTA